MNGIKLIAKERNEQITKHNRSVEHDKIFNTSQQLRKAALFLITNDYGNSIPEGWDKDKELWDKMQNKPYKERLIIAGALLAAEIDRIS